MIKTISLILLLPLNTLLGSELPRKINPSYLYSKDSKTEGEVSRNCGFSILPIDKNMRGIVRDYESFDLTDFHGNWIENGKKNSNQFTILSFGDFIFSNNIGQITFKYKSENNENSFYFQSHIGLGGGVSSENQMGDKVGVFYMRGKQLIMKFTNLKVKGLNLENREYVLDLKNRI
jgi:hypothetical protein